MTPPSPEDLSKKNYPELTYWNYIRTDELLTLQHTITKYPDENAFIIFHQIAELYFKLILNEIEQIVDVLNSQESFYIEKIERITLYFRSIINCINTMPKGIDKNQFLRFRQKLGSASGFQSLQYRLIELGSTDPVNLITQSQMKQINLENINEVTENLYWKISSTDPLNEKKTKTLRLFENEHSELIKKAVIKSQNNNIWKIFLTKFSNTNNNYEIINKLREYDHIANISWPLAHLNISSHYLTVNETETISSTGNINWRKYLSPEFQKICFFPELWTMEEKLNWGKKSNSISFI
jgi:tryptophan 2,3-dioxygenase